MSFRDTLNGSEMPVGSRNEGGVTRVDDGVGGFRGDGADASGRHDFDETANIP